CAMPNQDRVAEGALPEQMLLVGAGSEIHRRKRSCRYFSVDCHRERCDDKRTLPLLFHQKENVQRPTLNPPSRWTGSAVASAQPASAVDGLRRGEHPTF